MMRNPGNLVEITNGTCNIYTAIEQGNVVFGRCNNGRLEYVSRYYSPGLFPIGISITECLFFGQTENYNQVISICENGTIVLDTVLESPKYNQELYPTQKGMLSIHKTFWESIGRATSQKDEDGYVRISVGNPYRMPMVSGIIPSLAELQDFQNWNIIDE